jgi:threonine dehydrogenase-like Zn-dependent dehydrogenase
MKALTWHGRRDVRVEDVPDPAIKEPTDAVVRITTTAICGSDLHLYEVLGPFMTEGDILGHEPIGVVEEVGADVGDIRPGDRVVIPFNISCGHCAMCDMRLYAQCETTQVREYGTGASLFGYTRLYGHVPGGQAEYLRVPQAQFGPIKVPEGPPDERFLYLSDVLPTAWQAVEFADVPEGGSVTVLGLGPVGQMAARIARHRGRRVIGVDLVPERLEMARRHDIEVVDAGRPHDVVEAVLELTRGRGTDAVIEAVGMEAHGAPAARLAQQVTAALPGAVADLRAGQAVFALADPGGRGLRTTFGLVTATGRSFRGPGGRRIGGSIEHSAPLPRGSSGAPLVDAAGRLLGINSVRMEGGLLLALPADAALQSVTERLARGEVPARPRLGLALAPARAARRLRAAVGLPERDGLLVRGVESDSPAAQAGLEKGDLLVAAAGRPLEDFDTLLDALEAAKGELPLTVVRGTEERKVTAHFSL